MISIYRISGIELQCPINLRIFFHSFSRRLSIRSRIVPPRVRGSLTIPAPDLIGKEEKDDAWYTNGYFGIDA